MKKGKTRSASKQLALRIIDGMLKVTRSPPGKRDKNTQRFEYVLKSLVHNERSMKKCHLKDLYYVVDELGDLLTSYECLIIYGEMAKASNQNMKGFVYDIKYKMGPITREGFVIAVKNKSKKGIETEIYISVSLEESLQNGFIRAERSAKNGQWIYLPTEEGIAFLENRRLVDILKKHAELEDCLQNNYVIAEEEADGEFEYTVTQKGKEYLKKEGLFDTYEGVFKRRKNPTFIVC